MERSQRAVRLEHDPRGTSSGAPEAVRAWLLGGYRISVGLRVIEESRWRLRKAASLIKLLALSEGHRLHREQVMEMLWPQLDTKAATNNLHYALYHARQVLEPARRDVASRYLRLEGEQLELCPGSPIWIDVEAFEEAAATARRIREPAAYTAAIELYAGELLPKDRYESWVESRRVELRETYVSLLIDLATLYEERNKLELAIEALQKVVAVDQTREEAHAGLMRLYVLSGRQGEAHGQYEHLREVLSKDLDREPGAASRRLYEEIVAGRFPPSRPSQEGQKERPPEEPQEGGRNNLPVARTSFVGREQELIGLKRELSATWLVTLTGPGGSGKTRLALEVAKDLVGTYPDGVWRVELAGLSEPRLVPQAVATALEVREQPGRPLIDTLVDALKSRKTLLVLDNCEHLLEACARLVEMLLGSCAHVRILATSREALGVAGEVNWPVFSLTVPDTKHLSDERLMRYEAVRLFVDRAHSRQPGFALTSENVRAVVKICRKLEGIPLAIELAAARVGMLSVEQIAGRLEGSIKLLTARGRIADPRHRTLRETLDWSHELLSEPERKLFERLSVFTGGWTLEAAEEVGAGESIAEEAVLDLLSRLVDKSLVVAEPEERGTLRYRMLEPIRQYGREKLVESGEAEPARRRHAAFFLALAEEAEPGLRGRRQAEWLERLEIEHDNLRAALSWALEGGEAELGLRLAGTLGEFWWVRGHVSEARRWLEAALAKEEGAPPTLAQAKALAWAGQIACEQCDYERSMALGEESLALSREVGDAAGVAAALYTLGWAAMGQNELERCSVLLGQAVTLQRASGDTAGVARSLALLGFAAYIRRDHERAMALYEESSALARAAGGGFALTLSLGAEALVALTRADHRRASLLIEEGLRTARQVGMTRMIAAYLLTAAAMAGSQGRAVRSARLWGAAEAVCEAIGALLSPVERYTHEPYIDAARAQLDEAVWEAAWVEGKAMPLEEAIEYALSEEEEHSPAGAPASESAPVGGQPYVLTRREQEVALLVARGLSNRRIAEELTLSEHTAATHVRNILKKLGLDTRTRIAAWVRDRQPLPQTGLQECSSGVPGASPLPKR